MDDGERRLTFEMLILNLIIRLIYLAMLAPVRMYVLILCQKTIAI